MLPGSSGDVPEEDINPEPKGERSSSKILWTTSRKVRPSWAADNLVAYIYSKIVDNTLGICFFQAVHIGVCIDYIIPKFTQIMLEFRGNHVYQFYDILKIIQAGSMGAWVLFVTWLNLTLAVELVEIILFFLELVYAIVFYIGFMIYNIIIITCNICHILLQMLRSYYEQRQMRRDE